MKEKHMKVVSYNGTDRRLQNTLYYIIVFHQRERRCMPSISAIRNKNVDMLNYRKNKGLFLKTFSSHSHSSVAKIVYEL